jgi:hypothetical protein
MAALASALATIAAKELDANESALAQCFPPPPALPPEVQQHLAPFLEWCAAQKVRAVPCRPTSLAAYLQWEKDRNTPKENISATLAAVEQIHNAANYGNPIASPVVRIVTAASTISAPRSWTRDEQQLFTELPIEIQAVVARREKNRETELRRAQNEAGELRRLFKTAADSKPVEVNNEQENENGKEV